jgi:hypothetical protein
MFEKRMMPEQTVDKSTVSTVDVNAISKKAAEVAAENQVRNYLDSAGATEIQKPEGTLSKFGGTFDFATGDGGGAIALEMHKVQMYKDGAGNLFAEDLEVKYAATENGHRKGEHPWYRIPAESKTTTPPLFNGNGLTDINTGGTFTPRAADAAPQAGDSFGDSQKQVAGSGITIPSEIKAAVKKDFSPGFKLPAPMDASFNAEQAAAKAKAAGQPVRGPILVAKPRDGVEGGRTINAWEINGKLYAVVSAAIPGYPKSYDLGGAPAAVPLTPK